MSINRKKGCLITALVVTAIIAITVIIGYNVINKKLESFSHIDFSSLNLSTVEDGTYSGSADGSIVKATVEVTVKDHMITAITIINHDNGMWSSIIKAAVLDALTN